MSGIIWTDRHAPLAVYQQLIHQTERGQTFGICNYRPNFASSSAFTNRNRLNTVSNT